MAEARRDRGFRREEEKANRGGRGEAAEGRRGREDEEKTNRRWTRMNADGMVGATVLGLGTRARATTLRLRKAKIGAAGRARLIRILTVLLGN